MIAPRNRERPLIAVVGPCKSGKSTLVKNLEKMGFNARQVAQEHSFAPSMWQQITNPDFLIFLNCEYESTLERGLNWMPKEYEAQLPRLSHARQHAHLVLTTDEDSPQTVLNKVVEFLDFEARNKPLAK